ncbi:hypothetical protein JW898_00020 [Candidatus Woesearchaeota archaeon]|nr:hypothetical protein [Candidatus Woesearchaeota archaeon]
MRNYLAALLVASGLGCYSAGPAESPVLLDSSALHISVGFRNGMTVRYTDEPTKSGLRCRYEFECNYLDDKPSNDVHAEMSTAGELEEVVIGGVRLPPENERSECEQEQWDAVSDAFNAVMIQYGPALSVFNRCR